MMGRISTSNDEAADLIQQARFYRTRAKRIRGLATAVSHPAGTASLRTYADEIEQRAIELEARAENLTQAKPQEHER
ncbi:MAG: hypothetical protein ACRDFS_07365 [Chloroflexota bacterium]